MFNTLIKIFGVLFKNRQTCRQKIDNAVYVWYTFCRQRYQNEVGGLFVLKDSTLITRQSNDGSGVRTGRLRPRTGGMWNRICMNKWVYILFLPALVYFGIFCYYCMYGITIAFKDYKPFIGIAKSEWVGFKYFGYLVKDQNFLRLVWNTIKISALRIVFCFPIPIIFALLMNEVKNMHFRKVIQTITCFPNFISWVIFAGIVYTFTGPNGAINLVLKNMGVDPVNLVTNPKAFIPLLLITDVLKNFGWSAIVYMASLSSVDPQLYEAAAVDGAGRMRQTWHITLPGIRPIIALNLLMSIANILSAGFDQVFMFIKPSLYNVGDILDTYVYRIGMISGEYELSTALGLMKSVVSVILIVTANKLTKKIGGKSLW